MSEGSPVRSRGLIVLVGVDLAVSVAVAMAGWRRDEDLLTILGVLSGLVSAIVLWAMLRDRSVTP